MRPHAILGLIGLIGGVLSLNASPAFLQDTPAIVYAAEVDGNRDIYSMSPDGSNIQRLTDDPAEESSPVWSPDHSQIAFISNRTGDFEIFVMNADGSNQTNVSRNNHYNSAPAWSPDGQKLLFISAGTRSTDIFMMNPDGSDPVTITADAYEDLKAIFSPDARSVYYISLQDDQPPGLYVMDVNGQNARALLTDPNEEYDAPILSPDGKRLAYVVTRFDAQGSVAAIYTSDLNGEQVSLVTEMENAFITSLSWSPQGDELVYALNDTAARRKQLYMINVENGGSQTLSDETLSAYDVSWSSFAGAISDGSVLFRDHFEDNRYGWEESESGYSVVSVIQDGHYTLDSKIVRGFDYWVIAPGFNNWSAAPVFTEPYELEFRVMDVEAPGGGYGIAILFDVQRNYKPHKRLFINDNGSWQLYRWSGILELLDEGSLRGGAIDFADGRSHLVSLRVETDQYTVFVDGKEVLYMGSFDPIRGTVGFGVARGSARNGDRIIINFDDLVVRSLVEP